MNKIINNEEEKNLKYVELTFSHGKVVYFRLNKEELEKALISYENGNIHEFITSKGNIYNIRMSYIVDLKINND
ncbi:hypothetical protein G9F71_008465 [Clostridium sp. FP2]|uniref:hypothetical protein n=1 Tax=Clostridium sp. FP2 TaxID=2724481 RepID=UPI0013E94406|nr:hypothetical protein [Clostridium sp. FP2]MBZ9622885.1 hypothetical protein [Clostridium sp. FP2]